MLSRLHECRDIGLSMDQAIVDVKVYLRATEPAYANISKMALEEIAKTKIRQREAPRESDAGADREEVRTPTVGR